MDSDSNGIEKPSNETVNTVPVLNLLLTTGRINNVNLQTKKDTAHLKKFFFHILECGYVNFGLKSVWKKEMPIWDFVIVHIHFHRQRKANSKSFKKKSWPPSRSWSSNFLLCSHSQCITKLHPLKFNSGVLKILH